MLRATVKGIHKITKNNHLKMKIEKFSLLTICFNLDLILKNKCVEPEMNLKFMRFLFGKDFVKLRLNKNLVKSGLT